MLLHHFVFLVVIIFLLGPTNDTHKLISLCVPVKFCLNITMVSSFNWRSTIITTRRCMHVCVWQLEHLCRLISRISEVVSIFIQWDCSRIEDWGIFCPTVDTLRWLLSASKAGNTINYSYHPFRWRDVILERWVTRRTAWIVLWVLLYLIIMQSVPNFQKRWNWPWQDKLLP